MGVGAVTVTSTDLPSTTDPDVASALSSVTDLQTSTSISYGGGLRYALSERLDVRFDVRQYLVFSVTGIAQNAVQDRLEDQVDVDLPKKDSTVHYNELTVGISFNF